MLERISVVHLKCSGNFLGVKQSREDGMKHTDRGFFLALEHGMLPSPLDSCSWLWFQSSSSTWVHDSRNIKKKLIKSSQRKSFSLEIDKHFHVFQKIFYVVCLDFPQHIFKYGKHVIIYFFLDNRSYLLPRKKALFFFSFCRTASSRLVCPSLSLLPLASAHEIIMSHLSYRREEKKTEGRREEKSHKLWENEEKKQKRQLVNPN